MPNIQNEFDEALQYIIKYKDNVEALFIDTNRPNSEYYTTLLAYFIISKLNNEYSDSSFSRSINSISEKNTKAHQYIHLWYDIYSPETGTNRNAYKQLKNYIKSRQYKYAIHFTDKAITAEHPLGFTYAFLTNIIQLNTGLSIGKIDNAIMVASPGKQYKPVSDEAISNLCLMSGSMECFELIKSKKSIRKLLRENAPRIFNMSADINIKENILHMYLILFNQKIENLNPNVLKLGVALDLKLEELMLNLSASKILQQDPIFNEDLDFI